MNIAALIAWCIVALLGLIGVGVLSKGVHDTKDDPNKDELTGNFILWFLVAFAFFFGGIGGISYTVEK